MCRSATAPSADRASCSTSPRSGSGASALSLEEALARLKPLLEDPGVLKIGHDIKGAAHLLLRYGIALAPYDCTMLMSYVLDGGQFEHTIEELAQRAFEHELTPLKELVGTGKSLICFAEVATARGRATSPPSAPMRRCACTRC